MKDYSKTIKKEWRNLKRKAPVLIISPVNEEKFIAFAKEYYRYSTDRIDNSPELIKVKKSTTEEVKHFREKWIKENGKLIIKKRITMEAQQKFRIIKYKIYKVELKTILAQEIIIPIKAKILSVKYQNGIPTLWYMFDEKTELEKMPRVILMVETGPSFNVQEAIELVHLATLTQENVKSLSHSGNYVSHVFEMVDDSAIKKYSGIPLQ